jgi:hypothetical protein
VSEYLYVFGYEADDHVANDEAGTDRESTGVFRLEAGDADEALDWGRRLSSWYVENLGDKTRQTWHPESYASWIEAVPDAELEEFAQRVPLVRVGELPSHRDVRRVFGD